MTDDWYSDTAATSGDRIAAAREARGMTEAELARRLGVREATLAAWEADAAEPRANRLQMLAGLLDVSLRWLLTGAGAGVRAPCDAAGDAAGGVDGGAADWGADWAAEGPGAGASGRASGRASGGAGDAELAALLRELRGIRGEMARQADRLGRLETRLHAAVGAAA